MKRLILGLFVCLAAASLPAATISVNFNGGNGNTTNFDGPSVTGSAGAVPAINWNNFGNFTNAGSSIVDSSNAAAGSISFNAPNVYGAPINGGGTSGGAGDNALMTGYLDNFNAGGSLVTVTGLGSAFTSGGYKILAYQNTDSAGSWGYSVTSGANTDTRYGQQTGGNGANYPLGPAPGYVLSTSTNPAGPGSAANYVELGTFFGSSFTLTGIGGSTGDGRVRLNGFQITSVPEPASLVLFSLGALGLFAVARRRTLR